MDPNKTELTTVVEKTSETKRKRLSKSRRTYIRRQKQAARKAGTEPRLPTSEWRP